MKKLFTLLVLMLCVPFVLGAVLDYDTFTLSDNSSITVSEGQGTAYEDASASGSLTKARVFNGILQDNLTPTTSENYEIKINFTDTPISEFTVYMKVKSSVNTDYFELYYPNLGVASLLFASNTGQGNFDGWWESWLGSQNSTFRIDEEIEVWQHIDTVNQEGNITISNGLTTYTHSQSISSQSATIGAFSIYWEAVNGTESAFFIDEWAVCDGFDFSCSPPTNLIDSDTYTRDDNTSIGSTEVLNNTYETPDGEIVNNAVVNENAQAEIMNLLFDNETAVTFAFDAIINSTEALCSIEDGSNAGFWLYFNTGDITYNDGEIDTTVDYVNGDQFHIVVYMDSFTDTFDLKINDTEIFNKAFNAEIDFMNNFYCEESAGTGFLTIDNFAYCDGRNLSCTAESPCTPAWVCDGYGACNASDLSPCNSANDTNACGVAYSGDYSEFSPQACDYCDDDTSLQSTTACDSVTDTLTKTYEDANFATCCNQMHNLY